MWNPTKDYVNDINNFLEKNGAKTFGYDTWRLLIQSMRNGIDIVPTMILAPSDKALEELTRFSNRTWQEIYSLPEGKDILENHVSISETQKHWPMFTAINGKQYGSGQEDLIALEPTASTLIKVSDITKIAVIIINRVILHDDQLAKLRKSRVGYSIWQRIDPESIPVAPEATQLQGTEILKMGKDIFQMMVTDQNIRGRDLLALCTGNRAIAILCDRDGQLIFRRFLKDEFNFNYDKGFAKESPRELYAKFHAYRVEVYLSKDDDLGSVGAIYSVVKQNEKLETNEAEKEFIRISDLVAVPVDGWFAKNFSKPYVAEIDASNSLVRPNDRRESSYLIYVKDKPESASLVRRKASSNPWVKESAKFELSNDWFMKYFHGRSFGVTDQRLQKVANAQDLIRTLLEENITNFSFVVQTFYANEIVVFILLAGNEID